MSQYLRQAMGLLMFCRAFNLPFCACLILSNHLRAWLLWHAGQPSFKADLPAVFTSSFSPGIFGCIQNISFQGGPSSITTSLSCSHNGCLKLCLKVVCGAFLVQGTKRRVVKQSALSQSRDISCVTHLKEILVVLTKKPYKPLITLHPYYWHWRKHSF